MFHWCPISSIHVLLPRICAYFPYNTILLDKILFFIILWIVELAYSDVIENGLRGEPEVQCDGRFIGLNWIGGSAGGYSFELGHKMQFDLNGNFGCRMDAADSQQVQFHFPYNSCGVRRERSAKPLGIAMYTTVVVTFHPIFVTKVDRAFSIKCFFVHTEKTVFTDLIVKHPETSIEHLGALNDHQREAFSHIDGVSPQIVSQNVPMPFCQYEILENNSGNSKFVKYASIGQTVFHKWSCKGDYDAYFCMMVHSCFTDDGNGKKFLLVDQSGCPQDRSLMNQINYTDDLTGGVFSQVFKYADKPALFFQCQIHVAVKEDGQCQRPSENCSLPLRAKRSVSQSSWFQDYDVSFEIPTILDLADSSQLDSQVSKNFSSWNIPLVSLNHIGRVEHSRNMLCFNWLIVYYFLIVLCIISSLILSYVCRLKLRIQK